MGHVVSTDVELVEASRAGQVAAFAVLVERYQSLVCAVSYSATGDRALSEDVAQETFVAAWHGLSALREPSKLRAWLCGVARNLSSKALRRRAREVPGDAPVQAALDEVADTASPLDDALDKESERLVWAALHDVPETYREPLVLFYRQDKSTKQVAQALGLSESAVKQRLSRGRQHLKASVAELVERTLEHTKPTKGFAAGVVGAISAGAAGTADAASAATAGSALALAGGLLTMKTLGLGVVAMALVLFAFGGVSVMGGSNNSATTGDADTPTATVAQRKQLPTPQVAHEPTKSIAAPRKYRRLKPRADSVPASTESLGDSNSPASVSRVFKAELLEQLAEAEPLWEQCLHETVDTSDYMDGHATVRFIIAARGDSAITAAEPPGAVVELSEIDDEYTTITNAEFLECVRHSTGAMSFGALPDEVDAIAIGFQLVVENGAIAGSGGREFSLLRDTDSVGD